MLGFKRPKFNLECGQNKFCLGSETKIMGVLNVTPDSFSDGGFFLKPEAAESRALLLENQGAHILDIGGESSRPGAQSISAKEEIARISPVLKRLVGKIKIPISVDTTKDEVGQAALDLGASLINDITALKNNRRLAKRIARSGAGIVLMHMKGNPRTMQNKPVYGNVVKEISESLKRSAEMAMDAGISKSSIILDPGFGFGKTAEQNMEMLENLSFFLKLKFPVMAGLSRKSFIGKVVNAPVADRLYGSLAAGAVAVLQGAHILRVHDVLAHRQMLSFLDQTLADKKRKS